MFFIYKKIIDTLLCNSISLIRLISLALIYILNQSDLKFSLLKKIRVKNCKKNNKRNINKIGFYKILSKNIFLKSDVFKLKIILCNTLLNTFILGRMKRILTILVLLSFFGFCFKIIIYIQTIYLIFFDHINPIYIIIYFIGIQLVINKYN